MEGGWDGALNGSITGTVFLALVHPTKPPIFNGQITRLGKFDHRVPLEDKAKSCRVLDKRKLGAIQPLLSHPPLDAPRPVVSNCVRI